MWGLCSIRPNTAFEAWMVARALDFSTFGGLPIRGQDPGLHKPLVLTHWLTVTYTFHHLALAERKAAREGEELLNGPRTNPAAAAQWAGTRIQPLQRCHG